MFSKTIYHFQARPFRRPKENFADLETKYSSHETTADVTKPEDETVLFEMIVRHPDLNDLLTSRMMFGTEE